MKKILLLLAVFFSLGIFAQSPPEAINYQAVARNLSGVSLVNQTISVQYEILQGSSSGTVVYSETHSETTNQFGLFTSEVGMGSVNSGNFSSISWGSSIFYLQVTVDGDVMPATQLLSVPYALHAKTATSGVPGADGHNSLISSVAELAGLNCANGGYLIESGLDADDNNVLDAGEVQLSYYICNGVDGLNGTNGLDGNDGVGIDSTIHNADGTLTIYYSNSTTYTTNDLTGPAGSGGTTYFAGNGVSLSGDTITNLGDADADPNNELQVLSISGDTLFLSNGNSVQLPNMSETVTSIQDNGDGTYTYTDELGLQEVINTIDGDADSNNEIQMLSLNATSDTIFLTNGGFVALPNASGDTDWTQGAGVIYNTTDMVGIGTSTPTSPLTIQKTVGTPEIQFVGPNSAFADIASQKVLNIRSNGVDPLNFIQLVLDTGSIKVEGSGPTQTEFNVLGTTSTTNLRVTNGAGNIGDVLTSDAFGNASWQNVGSGAVITDGTTITGDGTAGSPITLAATIPTNTSDLTNDSGFITSPDDADNDPNNEIELPATATTNDVLTWNGSAWVAGVSPADGDSDPTNEIELPATASTGDVLVWNGSMWVAGTDQTADGDTDATNEIELPATASTNDVLIWNGSMWVAGVSPADGDGNSTNEIQNLSISGNNLDISSGTGTTISTNNPSTGDMLYFNGVSWIAQPVPADNDNQDLSSSVSGSDVTINIIGGNSASFNIDDADADATNEIQTLTFTSPNLTLSNGGGTVDLSSLADDGDWTIAGSTIYRAIGNVGIGENISGSNIKFRVLADDSVGVSVENNSTFYAAIDARNMGGGLAGKFRDGNVHIQNKLGIGNSATVPTYDLEIDGTTWSKGMRLGITGNEYDMPSSKGALGQVLTTNASGNAEWQPLPSADGNGIYGGSGNLTGNTTVNQTSNTLTFNSTVTNAFNLSSPVSGGTALTVKNETGGVPTSLSGSIGARISASASNQTRTAIEATVVGTGTGNETGIYASSRGTGNGFNRGIDLVVNGSTNTNIGADMTVAGNIGVNYGARITIAGTQTNNKYGVRITSSGAGTKYGIYSSGEDYNYFQGSLRIGTAGVPSQKLDVDGNIVVSSGNEYLYAAPKTHYYTLSAKDFVGGSPHNGDNWNNTGNIIYSYFDVTGNSFPIANAGFQIPDGARITDITAFIWDDDGSITYQPRFMVYEVLMASGSYGLVGTATLASDAASVQQLSIPLNKVVDNVNRSYHIKFQSAGDAGSNIRLYGVRITYTVDKAD